jgi:hypothetical protein
MLRKGASLLQERSSGAFYRKGNPLAIVDASMLCRFPLLLLLSCLAVRERCRC